jgi:hypothetical protein
MLYEQKPNSGSLWPNNRKEKPTHPDLAGTIDVNGVLYWINGWAKTSTSGKDWISLSVRPKEQQAGAGGSTPAPAGGLSKWSRPVVATATGQNPPAQETSAPKPTLPDEEVPF